MDSCEIKNIESITIGDTVQKVFATLGKPVHDDRINNKRKNSEFIGRRVMYIFSQKDQQNFNPKADSYLILWFDERDYLYEINDHCR